MLPPQHFHVCWHFLLSAGQFWGHGYMSFWQCIIHMHCRLRLGPDNSTTARWFWQSMYDFALSVSASAISAAAAAAAAAAATTAAPHGTNVLKTMLL
jgi:hypothetical protein